MCFYLYNVYLDTPDIDNFREILLAHEPFPDITELSLAGSDVSFDEVLEIQSVQTFISLHLCSHVHIYFTTFI